MMPLSLSLLFDADAIIACCLSPDADDIAALLSPLMPLSLSDYRCCYFDIFFAFISMLRHFRAFTIA